MDLRKFILVIPGLAFLVLSSCSDRATDSDRRRLTSTAQAFSSEFQLAPSRDIYLVARHLKPGCPSRERAEALYRAFWMDERAAVRSDSVFVYLNLQNDGGRFCFQLAWDPQAGRIEQSDQAYY